MSKGLKTLTVRVGVGISVPLTPWDTLTLTPSPLTPSHPLILTPSSSPPHPHPCHHTLLLWFTWKYLNITIILTNPKTFIILAVWVRLTLWVKSGEGWGWGWGERVREQGGQRWGWGEVRWWWWWWWGGILSMSTCTLTLYLQLFPHRWASHHQTQECGDPIFDSGVCS